MARWPFKRREQSVNPDEVQEYYTSGRRGGRGMTWLLAITTIIVTIVLAMAIFFVGRWAFNAIFGNDEEPNTVQQEDSNQESQSGGQTDEDQNQQQSKDNDGLSDEGQSNGSNESQDSFSDGQTESNSGDDSTSSDESSGLTPQSGPAQIPDTGPGPNGLQ